MKYDITSEGQKVRIFERIKNLEGLIIFLIALVVILMAIVITGILLILGNQSHILVDHEDMKLMQTDTLDKLNEISVSVDPEDTAAAPADPISMYKLSPDERYQIERVVAAEARGEDLQGQMAVAQTILDRAELWNMTPAEVVQAPGQYADPYQGEISDEVKLAVANVFDGGVRIFDQPVTHFYQEGSDKPAWADTKVNRGSVGRHEFYY